MTEMNRRNIRARPGGGYAAVYYVPQELQPVVGKREIVRGLGTRDPQEAMRRKAAALLSIQAEVHALASPAGDVGTRPVAIWLKQGSSTQAESITSGPIPISAAAQEWRGLLKEQTHRTRAKYERTLRLFQDHFKDCHIAAVTRRDAIHYAEHLVREPSERTGKPLSLTSVKAEVVTLASFFNACIDRGLLPESHENPFEKITKRMRWHKRERGEKEKSRAVTRDEAETLLDACDNAKREGRKPLKYSYEMQAIIRLLWVTGARANAIASLTRDRIDDHGGLLWLRVEDAKTDAGNRWLCLVGEPERNLVRDALRKADEALVETDKHGRPVVPEENRELLFPRLQRGGADRQPYWMIQKAFGAVREATFGKNPGWNMHSFRRRAVTALAEAGVPEQDRNLVIGHSNAKDFGIHVYADAERRKTVERTMRKLHEELGGSL